MMVVCCLSCVKNDYKFPSENCSPTRWKRTESAYIMEQTTTTAVVRNIITWQMSSRRTISTFTM